MLSSSSPTIPHDFENTAEQGYTLTYTHVHKFPLPSWVILESIHYKIRSKVERFAISLSEDTWKYLNIRWKWWLFLKNHVHSNSYKSVIILKIIFRSQWFHWANQSFTQQILIYRHRINTWCWGYSPVPLDFFSALNCDFTLLLAWLAISILEFAFRMSLVPTLKPWKEITYTETWEE